MLQPMPGSHALLFCELCVQLAYVQGCQEGKPGPIPAGFGPQQQINTRKNEPLSFVSFSHISQDVAAHQVVMCLKCTELLPRVLQAQAYVMVCCPPSYDLQYVMRDDVDSFQGASQLVATAVSALIVV